MANNALLREINEIRCLRALRTHRAMSRSEVGRSLGLSRATVGNAVRGLLQSSLVVETEEPVLHASAGRPGVKIQLNPKGGFFVGLDVSTNAISGVLVNFTMEVIGRAELPLEEEAASSNVVECFSSLVSNLLKVSGLPSKRLSGVGVAVPGIVNTSGRVLAAPYLGWRDFDLKSMLSAAIRPRVPVHVVNDAVAFANALLAEQRENELRVALVILLSEGIGSAHIHNGSILQGSNGFAGEIGHMILGWEDGTPQTFEMLTGYHALIPSLPIGESVAGAIEGVLSARTSTRAQKKIDRWTRALSAGLLNMVHILDPGRIVLGGPLGVVFSAVRPQVETSITAGLVHGFTMPPIEVASSGADSAAIGAAATVREEIFALPTLHKT